MKLKSLFKLILFGLIFLSFTGLKAQFPVIETAHGAVSGRLIEDVSVYRFADIPYAAAPTGDLRWMPPVSPVPWDTIHNACQFGCASIQYVRFSRDDQKAPTPHSEDCLRLNIWTPDTIPNAKRPVMVFVHGGGWIFGSGRSLWSNGAEFAKNGDLVFVNLQYRLGPLGWLDLEEIGGEKYKNSRNLGLLDLILGLKWVQENISQFGGDPNNVTLFGQSAGSANIMALALMPETEGLYHKLIAQSGTFGIGPGPEDAKTVADEFFRQAKAENIDDLLKLSVDEIIALYKKVNKKITSSSGVLFGPVYDGKLLPKDPYQALAEGKMPSIPFMNGTTEDEINMWIEFVPALRKIPGLAGRVLARRNGFRWRELKNVRSQIWTDLAEQKKVFKVSRLFTLIIFREPHLRTGRLWAKHAPVYNYRFDWPDPKSDLKAYHALELPFVFHHKNHKDLVGDTPPQKLFDDMHYSWINFARNGDPNHENLALQWKAFNEKSEPAFIFDKKTEANDELEMKLLEELAELRRNK